MYLNVMHVGAAVAHSLFSSSQLLGDVRTNMIELLGRNETPQKQLGTPPTTAAALHASIICIYRYVYTTLRETVHGKIDMIEHLEKPTAFFGTGRSVDIVDGHGFSMRHGRLK